MRCLQRLCDAKLSKLPELPQLSRLSKLSCGRLCLQWPRTSGAHPDLPLTAKLWPDHAADGNAAKATAADSGEGFERSEASRQGAGVRCVSAAVATAREGNLTSHGEGTSPRSTKHVGRAAGESPTRGTVGRAAGENPTRGTAGVGASHGTGPSCQAAEPEPGQQC